MEKSFVPATPTIAELEQRAKECEDRAEHEPEPAAGALREEAKRHRAWAQSLRSGGWTE